MNFDALFEFIIDDKSEHKTITAMFINSVKPSELIIELTTDITNSNIFDKTDITKMLFLYPLTAINEVKNEVIATLIYANIV